MYAKHDFSTDDKLDIRFRKATSQFDIELVYKMGKCWYRDYLASGDYASSYACVAELEDAAQQGHLVLAISRNKYAGFAELKVCGGKTIINVVYIVPSFRRTGIAKALYQYLINQYGASEIELTFRRVLERVDYWKSIGFESIKSLEGHYRLSDLCRLSTIDAESRIFSVALNKEDIQKYRNKQGVTPNIKVNPLDFFKFTNF